MYTLKERIFLRHVVKLGETQIAIITVVILGGVFGGLLIYSELITDEKRFLITELTKTNQTILGQSFEYPTNPPNVDTHFVELLPGAQTDWHAHDTPLIATVLHGEITVHYCPDDSAHLSDECPDAIVKKYKAGDSFVEAINTLHNGINDGVIPTKIHVVLLDSDT